MDLDNINNIFYFQNIREIIFKKNELYHPNLIANLSEEGYEIYLMRKDIYSKLLKSLDEKDIDKKKFENYIKNEIDIIKNKLKGAKSEQEIKMLKLSMEEYEEFL